MIATALTIPIQQRHGLRMATALNQLSLEYSCAELLQVRHSSNPQKNKALLMQRRSFLVCSGNRYYRVEAIATRVEAIATRVEAIATREEAITTNVKAIATRVDNIATIGWRPSLQGSWRWRPSLLGWRVRRGAVLVWCS